MNIVVLTKGEWQAFRIVVEVSSQMDREKDAILVWDDYSPQVWVEQMDRLLDGIPNSTFKQHALSENFGEHRNAALESLPRSEWVLMLDADEWILPGMLSELRSVIAKSPAADLIWLDRCNTFWDEKGGPKPVEPDWNAGFPHDYQGRLFINSGALRYHGKIHEMPIGNSGETLRITGNPVTLIHHKDRRPPRYTYLYNAERNRYGYEITNWDLAQVRYAQWLHPGEGKKTFTQEGLALWRRMIRPGDVCLDIGAHTGDTALYMALAAGPSGLVIAVEPNPQVLPILRANAAMNSHIAPVLVEPYAVTETPGEFTFHYSDPDLCNGGYAASLACGVDGGMHKYPLKVTGKMIGDIWPKRRVGFLKLDTEGYDKEILKFSRDLILRDRPVIKTEVFPDLNTNERSGLYDALESCGYTVLRSDFSGVCPKQEVLDVHSCFDIVGIPK